MSDYITIELDDAQLRSALRKAPEQVQRHLAQGVAAAALRVASEEKIQAPKAFSTLVNSIRPEPTGPTLQAIVGPHVEYARYVEEGTDGGGYRLPPHNNLLEWIRIKQIQPHDPRMSLAGLAAVIGKSIAVKGTPANPFRARTVEAMRSRVFDILRESTLAGLREAGFHA